VTASAYGLTVYGMAGFRPGAAHIFKNGLINVLLHLIASQVRCCGAARSVGHGNGCWGGQAPNVPP
jgi:hypothetical protein